MAKMRKELSRTPCDVIEHPDRIPGYSFGTALAARSPLTLDDLDRLKQAVGLTGDDEQTLQMAAPTLAKYADEMVTAWRAELAEHPYLACYSAHRDGRPNPEYSAASKPRFVQWVVDACTRPLDQAWLDYQEEIGQRHTRAKKNATDHVDSLDHIPMRYLLAFTAVVIATSRDYLSRDDYDPRDVDRMHAAFTKSVLLHVTAWTRPYVDAQNW